MAHEDHVLRRSVEIEDEVGLGLGLGVVMSSVWEKGSVMGGGAGLEDCRFLWGEEVSAVREGEGEGSLEGDMNGYGNGDEAVPLAEQDLRRMGSGEVEDARSEMSSMLESVSEDVVIGTAEVIDMRSRRVPKESRSMVRGWIWDMERIWGGDSELVCFHGITARNRRRARGERGMLGNEGQVEVEAEDGAECVVDTGEDGGSRGDGTGEVPVVPKEGEQGVRYPREMNCRKEKDEGPGPGSREATAQSRNESVPHSIQIVEGGATGIYASQAVEEVDEKGEKDN
jgi:hypothetical protein